MHRNLFTLVLTSALVFCGCDRESGDPGSSEKARTASPATNEKGEGAAGSQAAEQRPEVIELGTTQVDGQSVRATRDQGELKPGADAPIDIWIDGALGNAAAVRFWIGTEDAKGALKAKADVEDNHWHTHAEVPDPLPAGSRLWVEIESKDAKKSVVAFDLSE